MNCGMRNPKYGMIATAALALIMTFGLAGTAQAMLTARANHDHITIDFFYHGSTVSVKGESDPGVDLIIKMTAPEQHQTLKQKGKVGGLLWMNVGTLKFEHVPNFYAVYSTKKPEDILSGKELEKYTIGYPALEKHVEVTPVANEEEKAKWFGEFVKFQEEEKRLEGLFAQARKAGLDMDALGNELAARKSGLTEEFKANGIPEPKLKTMDELSA